MDNTNSDKEFSLLINGAATAIRRDDITALRTIYNNAPEIAHQKYYGSSLFGLAITFNSTQCAKFLFNNGEFDFSNTKHGDDFIKLVFDRNFSFIKELVDSANPDVIKHSAAMYQLLKQAITERDHVLSHYLLIEKEITLPITSTTQDNLLFHAVLSDNYNIAKYLITSGKYNVNSTSIKEETLLMKFAADSGSNPRKTDFIDFLLNHHDIDLEARIKTADEGQETHRTALHIAAIMHNSVMFDKLIEKGADIYAKSSSNNTPIHELIDSIYCLFEPSEQKQSIVKLFKNGKDLSPIQLAPKKAQILLNTLLDSDIEIETVANIFNNKSINSYVFYKIFASKSRTEERQIGDNFIEFVPRFSSQESYLKYIERAMELFIRFAETSSNISLELFSKSELHHFYRLLLANEKRDEIPVKFNISMIDRISSGEIEGEEDLNMLLDNHEAIAIKLSNAGDNENAIMAARNYLQIIHKKNISNWDDYQNTLKIIKLIEDSSTEAVDLSLSEAEKIIINIVKGVDYHRKSDLVKNLPLQTYKPIQTYCKEIESLGYLASKGKFSKLLINTKRDYISIIKSIPEEERSDLVKLIIGEVEKITRTEELSETFETLKQDFHNLAKKYSDAKIPSKKEKFKADLTNAAKNLKTIYEELTQLGNHKQYAKDIDKMHEIRDIGFTKQHLPPKSKNSSKLSSISENNGFTSGSYAIDRNDDREHEEDETTSVFTDYTNLTFHTFSSSILGTRSVFSEYTPFPDQIKPSSGSAEGGPGLAAGGAGGAPVISWPSENTKLKTTLSKLHSINKSKFSTHDMNILLGKLPGILLKINTTDGFLIKSLVNGKTISTHRAHKDYTGDYHPSFITDLDELVLNSGIYSHYGIDDDEFDESEYSSDSQDHISDHSFDSTTETELDLIGKTDE